MCTFRLKIYLPAILFSLFTVTELFAQESYTEKKEIQEELNASSAYSNELFQSDEILDLTIYTALKTLRLDNGENPSYHKGIVELDGKKTIEVKLKTRGLFRKSKCNCNMPPLSIKFKGDNSENIFDGQKKLKIVNVCNSRKKQYSQYVIKEYLIYKMYNLITENSFKVRLARITYKDTENKTEPLTKFAFFIERIKDMAKRNGALKIETYNLKDDRTNFEAITELSVFQYMIGNTDWSVARLHNIKLIQKEANEAPIAVPYDFDWTGMVNPVYGQSNQLGTDIKERVYRGYGRTPEQLEIVFNKFRNLKDKFIALYENCPYLDAKQKKNSIKYIEEFYELINNKRAVKYSFIRNCRRDSEI